MEMTGAQIPIEALLRAGKNTDHMATGGLGTMSYLLPTTKPLAIFDTPARDDSLKTKMCLFNSLEAVRTCVIAL